ncbi:unnamed protein product [Lota lota]
MGTHLNHGIDKRAEENAHAFLDKELKKLWRGLFLHYPQSSQSQKEEEEEVEGKNKEQRRRAIEGVVDITKLCLMEMNREELMARVYLDRPNGILSFYRVFPDVGVSSDTLTHIHTFQSTFTDETLLPGFMLLGGSVSLCRL